MPVPAKKKSPDDIVSFQIRPTVAQVEKFRRKAESDGRSINNWALRVLDAASDDGERPPKKGGRRSG
jgi:hypothetical protein